MIDAEGPTHKQEWLYTGAGGARAPHSARECHSASLPRGADSAAKGGGARERGVARQRRSTTRDRGLSGCERAQMPASKRGHPLCKELIDKSTRSRPCSLGLQTGKTRTRLRSAPAGSLLSLDRGQGATVYYYYFTKPVLRVKGGAWRCAGREAHKCALLASSCRPSKPVFGNRLELRLPVSMV